MLLASGFSLSNLVTSQSNLSSRFLTISRAN